MSKTKIFLHVSSSFTTDPNYILHALQGLGPILPSLAERPPMETWKEPRSDKNLCDPDLKQVSPGMGLTRLRGASFFQLTILYLYEVAKKKDAAKRRNVPSRAVRSRHMTQSWRSSLPHPFACPTIAE
jgi:hypothetical protein